MKKALNKIKKYDEEVAGRIDVLKESIESKKIEIADLKKEYSKDFLSGKKTDAKKMNTLKNELEELEAQYQLVIQALNEDEKMKKLAKEVYTEHFQYNDEMQKVKGKHLEEIRQKQQELDELKAKMNKEVHSIKKVKDDTKRERFEYIGYMDLNKRNRDNFAQETVGLTYTEYKRQEMVNAGYSKAEINEFMTEDFNNMSD